MAQVPRITKVVFFAFRRHGGRYEFFLVTHTFGTVALTGHVGDHVVNESLIEAVVRETREELGVKPLRVVDLHTKAEVELKQRGVHSTEHAFLVEVPDQALRFLEGDVPFGWVALEELEQALTFEHQRAVVPSIRRHLLTKP